MVVHYAIYKDIEDGNPESGTLLEEGDNTHEWGGYHRLDLGSKHKLKIGEKYGKTAAQVILRWDLQKGVPTIARSSNKERSRQNFDIFDFTLSCEDMAAIAAMETGVSVFYSHEDPVTVEKYAIGMLKK